jgi:hypothetical protein
MSSLHRGIFVLAGGVASKVDLNLPVRWSKDDLLRGDRTGQSESLDWVCRDGLMLEKRSPAPVAEKRDVQT